MPRPCSLCQHDQAPLMAHAVASGLSLRAVAKQFHISPATLHRHLRHTAGWGPAAPDWEALQQQLATLQAKSRRDFTHARAQEILSQLLPVVSALVAAQARGHR